MRDEPKWRVKDPSGGGEWFRTCVCSAGGNKHWTETLLPSEPRVSLYYYPVRFRDRYFVRTLDPGTYRFDSLSVIHSGLKWGSFRWRRRWGGRVDWDLAHIVHAECEDVGVLVEVRRNAWIELYVNTPPEHQHLLVAVAENRLRENHARAQNFIVWPTADWQVDSWEAAGFRRVGNWSYGARCLTWHSAEHKRPVAIEAAEAIL